MIYLDHAATSHPKPPAVLAAIRRWYEDLGVSAERGDGRRCREVRAGVDATRRRLGELAGVPPTRIAFTSGATEALNLALRALLRHGDTVLTTAFEHSSVVRPLRSLQRERSLRLEVLPVTPTGGLSVDAAAAALAGCRPRVFVFTHASNVTGALFDAAALCELARRQGCTTLLDASQTAGLFDVAVGADLVAASAHKGLHGPPGLGFLAVRDGLELPGQKQGGTGSSHALDEHPTTWPHAFEAGTPNTPAILGLQAALHWLDTQGVATLREAALARTAELAAQLACKPQVRLLQPPGERTPVLSFVHTQFDPAELGALLDAAGVHVRTGFHCAPWVHGALGTTAGGTVRMSPGPGLTADEIRSASAAVAD
jgi:selenocysteine lyase/cysteine desulfurase